MQVVNTTVTAISLDKLAACLRNVDNVSQNEYMLRFAADDHEITVFPDGRAIINNTIDESQAEELYNKYVGELI